MNQNRRSRSKFSHLQPIDGRKRWKCGEGESPGRFSGQGSSLSLQGARVQSLVRELKSRMAHGIAKEKDYSQLIFDKGAKTIRWENNNSFNKWFWDNWVSRCKGMKLNPYLTPYAKINSKWIRDPNVMVRATKYLEDNAGESFFDLGLGREVTRHKSPAIYLVPQPGRNRASSSM